jgi:hypothetical protein
MPEGHYPGLFYPVWPLNVWHSLELERHVKVVGAEALGLDVDAAGRVIAVRTSDGPVEGDLFVEVHIVRKHEHLLNALDSVTAVFTYLTNETANDKQHIAVQTRHWVINHHDPIFSDSSLREAALDEVVEVEEHNESLFAFAKSLLSIRTVGSDELVVLSISSVSN